MAKQYKCPICKKSSDEKYRPFCSKRCADVDLGKWLGESYAIEAIENDTELQESEEE
jgi:endogenous inhibitor of DNA gyrase (YacG/DUF329 family)